MKRQTKQWGRILFNSLTTISLLLAIATAGLWVRSGFASEGFVGIRALEFPGSGTYHRHEAIWIGRGNISVILQNFQPQNSRPPHGFRFMSQSAPPGGPGPFSAWMPNPWMPSYVSPHPAVPSATVVNFPFWFLLLAVLALPLTRLIKWLRRSHAPGRCPTCGYDMRANPAKCSECGHEPNPVTT